MILMDKIALLVTLVSCMGTYVHSTEHNLRRKRLDVSNVINRYERDSVPSSELEDFQTNENISSRIRLLQDLRNDGQRDKNNEFSAVPLHQAQMHPIVFENLVSFMDTLDLSMSYVATPTDSPTKAVLPTLTPTVSPTGTSTRTPSATPTSSPITSPTVFPTKSPTSSPSAFPSLTPTNPLTASPSASPTKYPTLTPSLTLTIFPTLFPSIDPTGLPSLVTTQYLSETPSLTPTKSSTISPSKNPTGLPSLAPSIGCTLPAVRELDIRNYAESISSTFDIMNPSTPQYEALQWMLNSDLNTNACDGFTSIAQRFGLAMFYFSTNGSSWTSSNGWLEISASECDWEGVTCNKDSSLIEVINLPQNKIAGSIPDEFFYTTPSLTDLFLWSNNINGTLPASIGTLTQFRILDIEANKFTGPLFTPEFSNLTDTLRKLWVSSNEFEDEIPSTIGDFSLLDNLWIAGNKLQGTLPTELGMLTLMEKMLLYNNPSLSGAIPSELANLDSTLIWIDVRACSLSGTIPEEIYELSKLERLVLRNNSFTGSISSSLASLLALEQLVLSDNMFTSQLPDITDLNKMKNLEINNNEFSGVLPNVSQWSNLRAIDVSNNKLTGSITSDFFENKPKLKLMYFSNNSFVGPIPPNYYSPPKLIDLYLDGNSLTGQIPSPPLDGFASLDELLLQNNDFTGVIPADLCSIRKNNNITFVNLFVDCAPDPNNNNVIQTPCPDGCCNMCFI